MDHLDAELLSAYIDKELPAADAAAVERHLASCGTCRTEYQDLRGISTLMRALPVYRPRREIDLSSDDAASPAMARIIAFTKPLAVAALVLLIAFAGLRLVTDIGQDDVENGDEISFSALQPTPPNGTESFQRASDTTAGEAPAAPEMEDGAMQEAPPRMGAVPPTQAGTPLPEAVPAAPAEGGSTAGASDTWPAAVIIAGVVVILAGAAGWYTFVRSPRRPRR